MYYLGIGGGGFMFVCDEFGCYEVIDYWEIVFFFVYKDMYKYD